ncbi:hypothetical protein JW935_14435 [candidate division KSB1 bacterium]|nr:hypothetical protein [candidate division KSB1 bacterium]
MEKNKKAKKTSENKGSGSNDNMENSRSANTDKKNPTTTENNNTTKKEKIKKWSWSLIIAIIALIISCISAGFSYNQNAILQDTAKRQLRAYVSMQESGWDGDMIHKKIRMRYKLVNHGQTPAQITKVAGEIKILQIPLDKNFKPEYPISGDLNESYTVFPSEIKTPQGYIAAEKKFTKDEFLKIDSPDSMFRAFLFAQVEYVDVFADTHNTYIGKFYKPRSYRIIEEKKGNKKITKIEHEWVVNDKYNNSD